MDNNCGLIKSTFYNGSMASLTTNELLDILSSNDIVLEDDIRDIMCNAIIENGLEKEVSEYCLRRIFLMNTDLKLGYREKLKTPEKNRGTYGKIEFTANTVIKTFENSNVFWKELIYLSILRREQITKILLASTKDLSITMMRYTDNIRNLRNGISDKVALALVKDIYKQLYHTISNMHRRGIAHRDITTYNIFYTMNEDKYVFILADFSISTINSEKFIRRKDLMHFYNDPCEACTARESDLWMLGVSLWKFYTINNVTYHNYIKKRKDYTNKYNFKAAKEIGLDNETIKIFNRLMYDGRREIPNIEKPIVAKEIVEKCSNINLQEDSVDKLLSTLLFGDEPVEMPTLRASETLRVIEMLSMI